MKFHTLWIVPELTTRWKAQRADTPIDVVFESPVQLQSATLEVTDPTGAPVVADAGNLVQVVTTPPYRYKLPWIGPWSVSGEGQPYRLPAGNYSVVVRAKPVGGAASVSSAPYDRVSLVEVKSVQLFSNLPGQPLDFNPTLPEIVGQVPSQARPYGPLGADAGYRIFAEAASPSDGAPVNNTVAVHVETFPLLESLPPSAPPLSVRIRSLDVDDPAKFGLISNPADLDGDGDPLNVQDNRGSPKCGQLPSQANCLTGIEIPIPLGATSIWTNLTVSGQPGDNYRVAASTSATWLNNLAGHQPSEIGEVRVKDGSSNGAVLDSDGKRCVSEMLTVWRTLHLERDTTLPIGNDSQRNFIEGKVTSIVPGPSGSGPSTIWLEPDAGSDPIALDDGSPNLTSGSGKGRFENGSLTIGTGTGAQSFTQLDGNGVNPTPSLGGYVTRTSGFFLNYSFTSQTGGPPVQGYIARWNSNAQPQVFAVTQPIPGGPQIGTLTIAGVTWSDVEANGTSITLSSSHPNPPLRFRLVDDDQAGPAVPQSTYLTPGVDNNPYVNIFAQAYIRVQDIPGAAKTAAFARNVDLPPGAVTDQLDAGRDDMTDWRHTYWAGYVQGSFQGPMYSPTGLPPPQPQVLGDSDANAEPDLLGATVTPAPSPGSLIFLETIRDAVSACAPMDYVGWVVAHEVGHQFNLEHDDPHGIMAPLGAGVLCPSKLYFGPNDLNKIRGLNLSAPSPTEGE